MSILGKRLQAVDSNEQEIVRRVENEALHASVDENEIVRGITQLISTQFRDEIAKYGLNDEVKNRIRQAIDLEATNKVPDYEQQRRVAKIACDNVIGLGPLENFMTDPQVTEIIVQRYDNICVERGGIMYHVDATFSNEAQLQTIINRIVQPVGRQINLSCPIVDARLSDGSRVNATIPPASPDGATLSIRKFSDVALTGDDYIKLGSISRPMIEFLSKCVEGKVSMIVSGGTSSGKTTLLNMLSSYIPANELIITIEDSCELQLHQPNVRRLEARQTTVEGVMPITTQTLVKNSLRMRPDRIIVGEIRDGTIVDMMSAMSTGHEGSMSTVHANNPGNLMNSRMPILYGMNENTKFSSETQNMQISEALQLVVHIARMRNGKRKVTHITEICGVSEKGRVKLNDIFRYNEKVDKFEATGYVPEDILNRLSSRGIEIDPQIFEEVAL